MVTTDEKKIISFLTFGLGDEHFAINVGKVINILEMVPITKVPKAPEYLTGVINLRGEVLPVIDTNIKLGQGKTEKTGSTCILVIETRIDDEPVKLGALVDSVQEVLEFEDEQILPPPHMGKTYESDLITGVVENNEKFIMVLEINRLLAKADVREITKLQIRDNQNSSS